MKPYKVTLICLTLLLSLIVGLFIIEVSGDPKGARVKAWFFPRTYTLGTPLPQPWNAELRFAPPRSADEIDASTVLLEGRYSPSEAPYDVKNRVMLSFDGYDVLEAAMLKLVHTTTLVPGRYQVFLEITGQLKDGTPFASGMSGCIILCIPEPNAP